MRKRQTHPSAEQIVDIVLLALSVERRESDTQLSVEQTAAILHVIRCTTCTDKKNQALWGKLMHPRLGRMRLISLLSS